MNIKFERYEMEPESVTRFNLYKNVTSKKKETGEEYNNRVVIGYSLLFESCLVHIAMDKLACKKGDTSIREYIKEYKEVSQLLLNSLKI